MSNFTDLETRNKKLPSKDSRPNPNAEEDPPVHADVVSNGSEEGEIQDDYPVSTEQTDEVKDHHPLGLKRKRSPSIADPRLSNPIVLAACRPQDASNLVYLRFESWPQV